MAYNHKDAMKNAESLLKRRILVLKKQGDNVSASKVTARLERMVKIHGKT